MAAFPTTVATDSDLYIAVNATSTQLTDNPLTSGATTVNVIATAAFPTVGFISIDNEIIKYTGKTGTSFTGCTRGADGTSATSHVQNSQVFHNVIAAHHNVVKDDLIATQQFISDLIGRTAAQIKAPDGSASGPSHSFASETNTGMYRASSNQLGFAVGGTLRARITTAGLNIDSGGLFMNSGTIQNQDGSAGSPSYTFGADTDTGIYRSTSNRLNFAIGGTSTVSIDSTQIDSLVKITLPSGTAAAPTHSFSGDTATGVYLATTSRLGLAANGTEYLTVGLTGAAGAIHSGVVGGFDNSISSAGNAAVFYAIHTSATANSDSFFVARTAAGGGDPAVNFNIASTTNWTMGIDNSDSDAFVITEAASLGGVNNRLRMPTGGQFQIGDGSAGSPQYSFIADTDTGIYRVSANVLGISVGGIDKFHVNVANSANDVTIEVYDFTAATLKQVSRGATDSGGTGFRVLRIPN